MYHTTRRDYEIGKTNREKNVNGGIDTADEPAAPATPRKITALKEMTKPTLDVQRGVTVILATGAEASTQNHGEPMRSPVVQKTTTPTLDGNGGVAGVLMDKPRNGTEREQIQSAEGIHKTANMARDDSLGKSAYILLLGKEEQGYAECVEKVMIARKCLISLGYLGVGAFTSTQVTTNPNPKNNVSSVDKYNEMLRDSECHGRKWIQLAPRNIKARNDHEFLRQVKSGMTLSGCYGQY